MTSLLQFHIVHGIDALPAFKPPRGSQCTECKTAAAARGMGQLNQIPFGIESNRMSARKRSHSRRRYMQSIKWNFSVDSMRHDLPLPVDAVHQDLGQMKRGATGTVCFLPMMEFVNIWIVFIGIPHQLRRGGDD